MNTLNSNLKTSLTPKYIPKYNPKKKKKKYDVALDTYLYNLDTYLYNKKRNVNPLANIRPRKGACRIVDNESQEVRSILYPFIREFISTRLTYRKMPKTSSNDKRKYLLEYFGKIKTKYTNSPTGAAMVEEVLNRTEGKFTRNEIINTFINIIYQQRIDYLSFLLKTVEGNMSNQSESKSIWSKISEHCHT